MIQAIAQQAATPSDSLPQLESRSIMKRIGDIVMSIAAIGFSLPLVAVVALTIKLHDGGPVLVSEHRRTANGGHIRVFKFRTIAQPRGETGAIPQPTAVGRFLYYTRLVDLPQLVNVLRGDMSLLDAAAIHPDFCD